MSFNDQDFLPGSHIVVLFLLPVAAVIMLLDATRAIDLQGAGLPILMVTATVATIQWQSRRRQQLDEEEADNG